MEIERYDSGNRHRYVVWNDFGSAILASAIVDRKGKEVVIDRVNVKRSRRGEGIGAMLLDKVLGDFENEEVVAYAFESRVNWYCRHGFEPESRHGSLVKVRKTPDD